MPNHYPLWRCHRHHCHLHLVNRAISRFFVRHRLCHSHLSSVVPSATAHVVHISLVVALTFHILTPHIRHFELTAPIRHLFLTLTKGLAIIPLPNWILLSSTGNLILASLISAMLSNPWVGFVLLNSII